MPIEKVAVAVEAPDLAHLPAQSGGSGSGPGLIVCAQPAADLGHFDPYRLAWRSRPESPKTPLLPVPVIEDLLGHRAV